MRLLVGFLTGAVVSGLTLPTAWLLGTVLEFDKPAETWFDPDRFLYGFYGASSFFASLLTGRIAERYEVPVAAVSVPVGLTCALAVGIYLLPQEEGLEPIPLPFALLTVGWPTLLLAFIGGSFARLVRKREVRAFG